MVVMSEPRCAVCRQKILDGQSVAQVRTGEVIMDAGDGDFYIDKESRWGEMHEECFRRLVGDRTAMLSFRPARRMTISADSVP